MLRGYLTLFFAALMAASANAAVVLSVGDATVSPGGTALVDVLIESDGSDPLQSFGFEFRVSTGGATRLEFVDPQPDSQLTDSDYLFFGDSFAQINGFAVGAVSTSSVPNDTFIGGDSTDSFADVTLTTSRLLARLQVTAATALPPNVGDTFTVTFDDTSFNTFFFDSDFSLLAINSGLSDFIGTVTVVAAAVPEPSSFFITCSLLLAFVLFSQFPRLAKHARRLHGP